MAIYSISRLRRISQVRDEARGGFAPERLGEKDFVGEAAGNGGDQGDHKRFDQAEAAALQRQDDQDVERGDQHAGEQRQAEEQLQRDGGAQHFGQVAGGDGDFAEHPQTTWPCGANNVRGRPAPGRGRWRCPAWRRAPAETSPSGC